MNKGIFFVLIFVALSLTSLKVYSQEVLELTIEDVITIAQKQSPTAISARHRFRNDYWRFRTHKASFLPHLTFNATLPDLNRSIERLTLQDGSDAFIERKLINSLTNVELSQNVGFTGGNIFISSEIQRIDILGSNAQTSYLSNPVNIGFRQPINGYNSYKWEKLIEPLRYEEAKRNYISAMEMVSIRAINNFFELAVAQKNLEISELNYSNADTLFRIAQGRYNLGTIAENELLQMELTFLNADAALNEAQMDLKMKKYQLNSFLGLSQEADIKIVIPHVVPKLTVDPVQAISEARKNNPDILNMQRQLLEAERDVANSKSQRGLNASLFATFGLSQRATDLGGAYIDPQEQERIRVGVSIPIADWGLGRGKVRMAQSAQEMVRTNVRQTELDFQQEILLRVNQFNLQENQLQISSKADTIAAIRYEVSKQRFLIGKISVLDLNVAQTEKDVAARGYINALRNYWSYFFNVRSLTLYDWINNKPLTQQFDELIR